jgi:hypothetical protein
MRRRLWVLLTALLLVVAIGDTIAWYFAVRQMRTGLADWIAARRAAGWSVTVTAPEPGGWPLAATLTLGDVALQGGAPDIPDGLDWRAQRVVLRLDFFRPLMLRIDADGPQHLRFADAPDIPYTAGRLRLLVPLRADASGQAFELRGEALRANVPVGGTDDALTLGRLDVDAVLSPTVPRGEPAVSMSARADGIGLPTRVNWVLGPRIASIVLDAAMTGPPPHAIGLTACATAWRDAGGSLDVQRLQMHWGVLGLTATAKLALDAQLQPTGTGTAQVSGYAETMDALARNGVMSRSAATTAKAVLSLLSVKPADGGASEVEVPLSLKYRTLSMQQLPLVRLPELDWPQP